MFAQHYASEINATLTMSFKDNLYFPNTRTTELLSLGPNTLFDWLDGQQYAGL
jgi:hypothetical protein